MSIQAINKPNGEVVDIRKLILIKEFPRQRLSSFYTLDTNRIWEPCLLLLLTKHTLRSGVLAVKSTNRDVAINGKLILQLSKTILFGILQRE